MLIEKSLWTFASRKPLTQWYGHVHLLREHAIGQWVCIDRASGELKWQRTMFRPNTICDVDSGVIVASETRSDGPWTAEFGCYGISLKTGQLLWTSHRAGLWGRIVRGFDFVPGFTNELRDMPHHVKNGKVFCYSGRVLDVRSGRLLERLDPEIVQHLQEPPTIAQRFHDSGVQEKHPKVSVGNGLVLQHTKPDRGLEWGVFEIAAETEDGTPLWQFSSKQTGRHISSYRLAPPFLYLVVSEEPRYKPHPTKEHDILPNPTLWHLLALDLTTGKVVQDLPLDDAKLAECRIEDIDDHGLLIGKSNCKLAYFRRTS